MGERLVVGLGEVLFDVLPEGPKLGGAPANFAYHVSQHGLAARAISAIGDDTLGRAALKELDEKGLAYVMERVEYPTGTVDVTLDASGIPAYEIRTDVAWDHIPFTDAVKRVAKSAAAVCWGSLAQRSDESRSTIRQFLDTVPKDCMRIFDINLRQQFYTRKVIEESLKRCNVLKINDEELEIVARMFRWEGSTAAEVCKRILTMYDLDMVVLTCGAKGSSVFAAEGVSVLPAPKVDVVDTVGAGDSFTGTFCAAILKGLSVEKAHRRAVEVSAYVCTQSGAMCEVPSYLK